MAYPDKVEVLTAWIDFELELAFCLYIDLEKKEDGLKSTWYLKESKCQLEK